MRPRSRGILRVLRLGVFVALLASAGVGANVYWVEGYGTNKATTVDSNTALTFYSNPIQAGEENRPLDIPEGRVALVTGDPHGNVIYSAKLHGLLETTSSPRQGAAAAPPTATIVGKLTAEGVECQAMRSDSGNKLYTLMPKSKLVGFKNGDHVRVVGKVQQVSTCQQATTVSISTISHLK